MHLLDKLAALAIILQFVAVLFFGWAMLSQLAVTRAQVSAVQAKLYEAPSPTVATVTEAPSPTQAATRGLLQGTGSAKTNPVLPRK